MIAAILVGLLVFFAGIAVALSWSRRTLGYLVLWCIFAFCLIAGYKLAMDLAGWFQ